MEIKSLDRRTLFPWIAALCIGISTFAVKELTSRAGAQGLPVTQPNIWPQKHTYSPGTTDASSLLGQPAAAFNMTGVDGAPHALSDWRGQVVVINFWGFWCDTWKAELPYLKQLSARQTELGFKLAAISVDGTRMAEFDNYPGTRDLNFSVLLDIGGRVSKKFNVRHVPTVVIIDSNGTVRYFKSGFPGNDAILSNVRRLINQGPGSAQSPLQRDRHGFPDAFN